jgi:hypothetical protein
MIRSDLARLHHANLGETALRSYIQRFYQQRDSAQAHQLEAHIVLVQKKLSGAGASLQKGLAAKGLEKAGRLMDDHQDFCKAKMFVQQPSMVAASDGLIDGEKVEQGLKIVKDTKDVKKKAEEIKKMIKNQSPMRQGALGKPATGNALFLSVFGEDIKDIILAELGDSNAYARHVGRSLYERIGGSLESTYAYGGQSDLLVNDIGQVYDKNNNFLGTLDVQSGIVVPSEKALSGYKPMFQFLSPDK